MTTPHNPPRFDLTRRAIPVGDGKGRSQVRLIRAFNGPSRLMDPRTAARRLRVLAARQAEKGGVA